MDTQKMLLKFGMVVMMLWHTVIAIQRCEQCNCQISTNEADSQKVHSMGLICTTGTVTWYGASGGLLLELSPYIYGGYRACFLVESDRHTFVKVSQEKYQPVRQANYRLKRPEIRGPSLKHVSTSSGKSKEFCVESSRKEPLVLFVESSRTPEVPAVSKVLIHYDMEKKEPASLPQASSQFDDCRPCTKDEILDAYCSMDFVVVGTMSGVQDNLLTGKTHITLAVNQLIHTAHPDRFQRVRRSDPHLTGHVVAPGKCGIQKGGGDFLFTGRMRLTELSLKCSIYFHEWRQIKHEAECSHS